MHLPPEEAVKIFNITLNSFNSNISALLSNWLISVVSNMQTAAPIHPQ